MIDPSRVQVVAIGIEHYEYGGAMDLPGSASDAVRFVTWATAAGVPPGNVHLGIRSLDPGIVPQAGVNSVGTTRDDVRELFVRTIAPMDADLLLVFWSGHGIVDDARQALFTSDAVVNDMLNVGVDVLLDLLQSTATVCRQQVIVIDACANYLADMRWDHSLPIESWSRQQRAPVAQDVLFAAAQGQVAATNRVERFGEFGNAILQVLHPRPEQPAPLALNAEVIFAAAKARLDALGPERVRQTPVMLQRRTNGQLRGEYGSKPIAGAIHVASALTPAQVDRIARAVAACRVLQDNPAACAAVMAEIVGVAVPGLPTPEDVRFAVRHALAFSDDLGRALFVTLRTAAAADELLLLQVAQAEQVWRIQFRIALPATILGSCRPAQAGDAYRRVVRDVDPNPISDVEQGLERAAQFPAGVDGQPSPLHELVAALEYAAGQQVPDPWFGLGAGVLTDLRQRMAPPTPAAPRLLIDLTVYDDATGQRWPEEVSAALHTDHGVQSSAPFRLDPPDLEEARRAVGKLVTWAVTQTTGAPHVGFLINRARMGTRPETWSYELLPGDPAVIANDFAATLHCAERLIHPPLRALWRDRGGRVAGLPGGQTTHAWIGASGAVAVRGDALNAAEAILALQVSVASSPATLRGDPVLAAVQVGAPYVLWLDPVPETWPAAQGAVAALVVGDLQGLPNRLRDIRAAGDPIGADVRLIWDDPLLEELLPLRLRDRGAA